jgi:hypothetical protein
MLSDSFARYKKSAVRHTCDIRFFVSEDVLSWLSRFSEKDLMRAVLGGRARHNDVQELAHPNVQHNKQQMQRKIDCL